MIEHKINQLDNFICGYYTDKKVCDELILYFENSNNKIDGKLYGGDGQSIIDKSKKSSTDVTCDILDGSELMINYCKELNKCIERYKKKYIYCDLHQDQWSVCKKFNIQKYKPSESYSQWHCETSGKTNIYRFLTFMTYLNDVEEGGETEWFYQKLKIKPEKGLTIIWGTNWQTTHKGVPAPKETKYITTGWYGYVI